MNDFLMNSLAADRIDRLQAEAARHRLARAAHPDQRPSHPTAPKRRRHFHLSWLLRRAAA
jgi:hypothetical protein